jgi:deoxyhypusine synthase
MATSTLSQNDTPKDAKAAVFIQSAPIPSDAIPIAGPNLREISDITALLESYKRIGFQATSLSQAVEIVQNMVCKLLFYHDNRKE